VQLTGEKKFAKFERDLENIWFDFLIYAEMIHREVIADIDQLRELGLKWAKQFIRMFGVDSSCDMTYPKLHILVWELPLQIRLFGKTYFQQIPLSSALYLFLK